MKARALGLPVHEKAESQEICFVPPGGLREFIESRAGRPPGPGPIVDVHGRQVGTHDGACYYTVGQRKGLGVSAADRLYVARIDAALNTVVVAGREGASSRGLRASDVRWVAGNPPQGTFGAAVQIRHRHRPAAATVNPMGRSFEVLFDDPQHGVAPGQAAVIYRDDEVIGGGFIDRAW